ncbi:MAG: hypothetical protein JRN11_04860 [Nitrososphaerota archaeon]|nr:hypothetical protein [Nitrososphaerota archaeon]MDG7026058.1 hypothetical protein [Nitrososphaerota archaeon]
MGRPNFVSNSDVVASRGTTATFGHLDSLKNAGEFRAWVAVEEEGHRLARGPNLRALLIEGRKLARKVILVTAAGGCTKE